MPQLKFLDSRAVAASELKEAKRVGAYTKIVKPSSHLVSHRDTLTPPLCSYTFCLVRQAADSSDERGLLASASFLRSACHFERCEVVLSDTFM